MQSEVTIPYAKPEDPILYQNSQDFINDPILNQQTQFYDDFINDPNDLEDNYDQFYSDNDAELQSRSGDEDETENEIDFTPSDLPEGHICMKKVMMVEEIVYDEDIVCSHDTYEMCWDIQVSRYKLGKVSFC